MTKIKFGDQIDDSRSEFLIISAGGQSEITAGAQRDRSQRNIRIIDLLDSQDLKLLASELDSLTQELQNRSDTHEHTNEVQALLEASEHAKSGDGESALSSLKKAGKWALDIAAKIGVPVATAAIKSSLNV
jgi:hypothetical protein